MSKQVKTIMAFTIILFIFIGTSTANYASGFASQNIVSDSNINDTVSLWMKNGWIHENDIKETEESESKQNKSVTNNSNAAKNADMIKLQEPITKLDFVKWVLRICNSNEIVKYNMDDLNVKDAELYRFAVDQGYINEGDNLQSGVSCWSAATIADRGFEAYNSLELFAASPDDSISDYQLYEKPLTKYEAIVFLERLRSLSPEIKIMEQKTGMLVTFNKGKGYLNGKPIPNETIISAVGSYKVDVSDKFGNTATAGFIKKPTNIVNPLSSYTLDRCSYEIDMLKAQYPDLIKSGSIGKSSLGSDIPYFTLGKGQRNILFVGSVHAREHITTAYIMKTADSYAAAYYNKQKIGNYDVQKVLNDTTITFVPMLNPDGVSFVVEGYKDISRATIEKVFGKIPENVRATWKETITGVNLNRNFPFYWSANVSSGDSVLKKISGASEASEPETKALMAFCKSNRFEFALACHAKGELLYWRDKKNGVISGDDLLAKTIAKNTGYKIEKMTTSASLYGGGFENWFRYAFKRPAICIEFTPHDYSALPHSNANFDKLIWSKASSLGLATASLRMPWENKK